MSPQAFIPVNPISFRHHSLPATTRPRRNRVFAQAKRPSSTPPPHNTPTWQEELATILDPTVSPSIKQVLTQDLLKRTPEILNSATTCTEIGLDGLAQVWRQMRDDILPDLVSNAPRYATEAVHNIPTQIVDRSRDPGTLPSMPKPDVKEIQREVRNVFNRTPEGVDTPQFELLAEKDGYEIRKYPNLVVAEANMKAGTTNIEPTEVENAAAMGTSFSLLAGYLFGKNKPKEAMKMTTPVILSKGLPQEKMAFIIAEHDSADNAPDALNDAVVLRDDQSAVYAVSEFSGFVTQGEAKRQHDSLLEMLKRDGVQLADDAEVAYKCLIYNGPSTLPNLRRNEMMVEVIYSIDNADENV